MGMFQCPECGESSYSADSRITQCPHCGMQKLIIINPEMLSLFKEFSNAKIILDRRSEQIPVSVERRRQEANTIPIAWLCYVEKGK